MAYDIRKHRFNMNLVNLDYLSTDDRSKGNDNLNMYDNIMVGVLFTSYIRDMRIN